MDLWINIARDDLIGLLGEIDGIIINDSEALLLTGHRNPFTAARAIMEMGPKVVIIKKGEHGAVLVTPEGVGVIPAYPADETMVVDPTGCGDSFAGGFMGYIASRGSWDFSDLQAAMAWGTVSASFTLGAFALEGLQGLTMDTLEKRMAIYQAAARVGDLNSVA